MLTELVISKCIGLSGHKADLPGTRELPSLYTNTPQTSHLSLSLSLSLSFSFSVSLPLTLSLANSLSHQLSLSHTLSLALSLAFSLSLSLSQKQSWAGSQAQTSPPSLTVEKLLTLRAHDHGKRQGSAQYHLPVTETQSSAGSPGTKRSSPTVETPATTHAFASEVQETDLTGLDTETRLQIEEVRHVT